MTTLWDRLNEETKDLVGETNEEFECKYCGELFKTKNKRTRHENNECENNKDSKNNKQNESIQALMEQLNQQNEELDFFKKKIIEFQEGYEEMRQSEEKIQDKTLTYSIAFREIAELIESLNSKNNDLNDLFDEKSSIYNSQQKKPFKLDFNKMVKHIEKTYNFIPQKEWEAKENRPKDKRRELIDKYKGDHEIQVVLQRTSTNRDNFIKQWITIINRNPEECIKEGYLNANEKLNSTTIEIIKEYLLSNIKALKEDLRNT